MCDLRSAVCFALLGVAYRFYRARFARLPLHMDTAFYVTNHAVATRHYRPFKSWNTLFSGGSRILPEFVHSHLFLRLGAAGYARGFRELYTWFALLTAVATGIVASRLVPGELTFWVAASACAALLAEAQFGAYFESAEAFQIVSQSAAIALLVNGSIAHAPMQVCAGLALLWLDFLLVKITSAVPALLVSAAAVWLGVMPLTAVLLTASLSALGYGLLVRASGQRVSTLWRSMNRHESYVRRNYPNPVKLLAVKVAFAGILLARNPTLPLFASLGALRLAELIRADRDVGALILYGAYGLGVLIAMLRQGNRVWYYMLPLLPPLALLVALAYSWLTEQLGELPAGLLFGAALLASVLRNVWLVRGSDPHQAVRRVFAVYNRSGAAFGDGFARADLDVEVACAQLRERVRGATLLVVGRYNQASVLLEAGYDTPIASVCELSEAVAGDLRDWLPERPREQLPAFLLDTENELPARTAQLTWFAHYELAEEVGPVRLYSRR